MKQRITKGRIKEWRKQSKRHFGCYVFFQPTGVPFWNALDEALSVIKQFNNQDVGSDQEIEDDVNDDDDDDE